MLHHEFIQHLLNLKIQNFQFIGLERAREYFELLFMHMKRTTEQTYLKILSTLLTPQEKNMFFKKFVFIFVNTSLFLIFLFYLSTFSLEQRSKRSNLDASLTLSQHKLILIVQIMKNKFINPKIGQDQITKQSCYSSSTSQRYRHDMTMQSPYKSSDPKRTQRSQMTSKDLKRLTQMWTLSLLAPQVGKPNWEVDLFMRLMMNF